MNIARARWSAWCLIGLVGTSGCHHCWHRSHCSPVSDVPPGVLATYPPAPGLARGDALAPPGPVVPAAPLPTGVPAGAAGPNQTSGSVTPSDYRGYGPDDSSWRPAPGSGEAVVRLAPPEPVENSAGGQRDSAKPAVPESPEPKLAEAKPSVPTPVPGPNQPVQPPAGPTTPPPSGHALPVGIPNFAQVRDGVATGNRPMLEDGLDWLQARAYRTILHVRRPEIDDSADRIQVEKRGMRYVSLVIPRGPFTRDAVTEFLRRTTDRSGQPIFVYGHDTALVGGLWYLAFRLADQEPDDVARVRAGRFGLKTDAADGSTETWLAVQQFMSQQP